ncbi:hypothetical protein [Streptomyces sp. SAJ15]|uniref:DUF6197 family protein n=1 Tax=Streptomyces sp. SAJ15 TaxID=2011095 RepID=UPI0021B23D5C|nr:hypothetical protein [Streptomyces sp. SAJ15]
MSVRLEEAGLAFEVNTAHIPASPALIPDRPLPAAPAPQPYQYRTPIAGCLQRAHTRLATGGWCAGLRDEKGAVCLVEAIRKEARTAGEAVDACAFLLDVIRAAFPHAETVPSWNDQQRDPRRPLRVLDRAARAADARGI